jgi:hypothetical protein
MNPMKSWTQNMVIADGRLVAPVAPSAASKNFLKVRVFRPAIGSQQVRKVYRFNTHVQL